MIKYDEVWYGDWYSKYTNPVKPTLFVGARSDLILFGPDGKELRRLVDRPFRGYRSNHE